MNQELFCIAIASTEKEIRADLEKIKEEYGNQLDELTPEDAFNFLISKIKSLTLHQVFTELPDWKEGEVETKNMNQNSQTDFKKMNSLQNSSEIFSTKENQVEFFKIFGLYEDPIEIYHVSLRSMLLMKGTLYLTQTNLCFNSQFSKKPLIFPYIEIEFSKETSGIKIIYRDQEVIDSKLFNFFFSFYKETKK